jgi:hypothetical protein
LAGGGGAVESVGAGRDRSAHCLRRSGDGGEVEVYGFVEAPPAGGEVLGGVRKGGAGRDLHELDDEVIVIVLLIHY